ncbi:hypothetical protein BuS5_03810 [Desulfosarcina sp. BuS5]|nr:hypothetical protein BuS5_03810 [Desulfosarcina sp. BuS5]
MHVNWAWKYCTTMKTDLSYGPSRIFETFPFPQNVGQLAESELDEIGEKYHELRSLIMFKTKIGLTKTYNLFNKDDLTVEDIVKGSRQCQEDCKDAHKNILTLRNFHKQMDEKVISAYGWEDIKLAHDFYEVDYLPENDRIRYTISPDARKEILKRLLKLNHEIHEQEVKASLLAKEKTKKKKIKKKQKTGTPKQMEMF